jgi:hypothetical protein
MTYHELRAALLANQHHHALDGVGKVRFLMLEGQLTRAVEARRTAERKLHEHICTENDLLNHARAENQRLRRDLDLLRQALSSAASGTVPVAQPVEVIPPRRSWPNRSKGLPMKSSSAIRNSELVQRALRGEPLPEPPEPGAFDSTIHEEAPF